MATLPPPPQPLWDSNHLVRNARATLPMIADKLARIARDNFGRRDVLTDAEIAAARTRLAEITSSIAKIDAELADPASGFRVLGGGISASLTGVSQ